MSFDVKTIVSELLEEYGAPFDRKAATLQYRPFLLNGEWQWFWVLIPEDKSKAYAHGHEKNRALAGTKARIKARKLGVVITAVDVLLPPGKDRAVAEHAESD